MGKKQKKREQQHEPTSRKINGTEVVLQGEGSTRTDNGEQSGLRVVAGEAIDEDVGVAGCHVIEKLVGEMKNLENVNVIEYDKKQEDEAFLTLHVFWGCTREHLIDLVVPASISLVVLKEKIQSSEELIGHVAYTASLWWVFDPDTKKATVLINKALEGAVTRLDDPTARQIGLRDGASLLIEGKPTHVALLAQSKIQALALDMRLMRDQLEVIGAAREEQRRQIAAFQQQMEQLRRRKEEHTRRLRDHFKAEAEEAKRMMRQQGGATGSEGGVGRHHQQQQQHPLAIILGAADRGVHPQAQTSSNSKKKKANTLVGDLNNNNNTKRPLQQRVSLARLRQEESEILQLEAALEREITLHRIREEAQQDVHFKHVARLESLTAQLVSMEEMAKRLSGMERMVREIAALESHEDDEDDNGDGEGKKSEDQEGFNPHVGKSEKHVVAKTTRTEGHPNKNSEDGRSLNNNKSTTTTTSTTKLSASRKRSDADLIDSMMLEFGQGVIKSVHSFKHRAGVGGRGGGERTVNDHNDDDNDSSSSTNASESNMHDEEEEEEGGEEHDKRHTSGSISSTREEATNNRTNNKETCSGKSSRERQAGKKRVLREAEATSGKDLPEKSRVSQQSEGVNDDEDDGVDAHHQKGAGIASGLGIGRLIDSRAVALYERQQQIEKAERERALLEKRKAIIAAIALAKSKAATDETHNTYNTNTSATPPPPPDTCTADPSKSSNDESATTDASTRRESRRRHPKKPLPHHLSLSQQPQPPAAFTFCAADTLSKDTSTNDTTTSPADADDQQQRQQQSQMDAGERHNSIDVARVSLLGGHDLKLRRLDGAAELEAYGKHEEQQPSQQPYPSFGWQFVSKNDQRAALSPRSLNNNDNNKQHHDVNETNNNNNKPCVVININAENDYSEEDIDLGIKYPPSTSTPCTMHTHNANKEEEHLDVDVKTKPSLLNASLRSVIRGVRIFS